MIMNNIANPRRTTLSHLEDADELAAEAAEPAPGTELPPQTANPRRTVLVDADAPGAA